MQFLIIVICCIFIGCLGIVLENNEIIVKPACWTLYGIISTTILYGILNTTRKLNMFKCKHPIMSLLVEKESTFEVIDKDFLKITYHLYCSKCKEKVKISYSKLTDHFKTSILINGK